MNICKNFKFLRLTRCCMRNFADTRPGKPTSTLEKLAHRELTRVHGAEVLPFLQGLVTNDVSHLQRPDGPSSIYAMFLNKGGRVLYDTIVYRTDSPDTYLLECDRQVSEEFRRHLRTFRVRKKIDIDSIDDEYAPWVLFNGHNGGEKLQNNKELEVFISSDPRLAALGTRILAPTDLGLQQLVSGLWRKNEANLTPPSSGSNYQLLRYKQGVGEGSEELPPGKCFPLEANADFLNGVSFNKGCYVGQELTARIHHSGVIRKRYMPIRLTAPLGANQTVQSVAGANLGRVFGHAHNHGVALLRIEQVLNGAQELVVDGERCFAERPDWWPSDLPSKRRQTFTD
ncbi:putative transferase CAF17, mitochondrial [Drosophila subobscura]|uniref:putative transferase CAF17, mitochondrial n=1 Tax=Drosophila subobscura TaxID=7241 RepID=UPI00155A5E2E|nr:putative transferase CAF17, mitochondrial [Drosophila subobscura]